VLDRRRFRNLQPRGWFSHHSHILISYFPFFSQFLRLAYCNISHSSNIPFSILYGSVFLPPPDYSRFSHFPYRQYQLLKLLFSQLPVYQALRFPHLRISQSPIPQFPYSSPIPYFKGSELPNFPSAITRVEKKFNN
jgi:hypothetical protein